MTLVFARDQTEAVARHAFEALCALNPNVVAPGGDQPLGPQILQALRDARAPHAQELAQDVVGQWNFIRAQSIAGEQEPSRETLLDGVSQVASARL